MLGRVYAIALVAITSEALVNGFSQIGYLNQPVFFVSAFLLCATVIGIVGSQWLVPSHSDFWVRTLALLALALLVTWPLHFDTSQVVSPGFQPWIWWPLGIAAIAAGTTFRFAIGVAYLVLVALLWPALKIFGFAGNEDVLLATQEAFHLFVFSSVLIALVLALRWEAGKTDSANQVAIASVVESARVEAVELERSRLDALVHDSVLTTLLIAARAESSDQKEAASKAAQDAIAKLRNANDTKQKPGQLTLTSFFKALEARILEAAPDFVVSVDRLNDLPIPSDVAQALTESTLQAVDNSLKHAGTATDRSVRLRGHKSGLKIVITDNGKGFRPSQVPKDRMGISSSIVARVGNIGGKVFLNSSPGAGTTIVIEWGDHD